MEREVLLSIKDLTVRYGKDVTLRIESPILIEEGDRVGIIGSNGAGKSTLIRSILGLMNYQGSIRTRLTASPFRRRRICRSRKCYRHRFFWESVR